MIFFRSKITRKLTYMTECRRFTRDLTTKKKRGIGPKLGLCSSLNLILFFFMRVAFAEAPVTSQGSLIERASESNLPIILFCLKSPSCLFSQWMQEDLIDSSLFLEMVESEAIIGSFFSDKLDSLHKQIQLAKPLDRLPCVFLLDPQGKEFARFEGQERDPLVFANRALLLIEDFHQVCLGLHQGLDRLDEKSLQELYVQSLQFSEPSLKKFILSKGLKQETGVFFHLEKYESLLHQLKKDHPYLASLRKKIIKRDPHNHLGAHRKLALIDFHKRKTEGKKDSVVKVIQPLISYLDRFAKKDREGCWKIEMLLSEFLKEKDKLPLALDYAKRAVEHAPAEEKEQISHILHLMQPAP